MVILLQMTIPKHRRNLPHGNFTLLPEARSERLLNTIALASFFETQKRWPKASAFCLERLTKVRDKYPENNATNVRKDKL